MEHTLVAEAGGFARAAGERSSQEDLVAFTTNYLRTRVLPDGESVVIAIRGVGLYGSVGTEALLESSAVQRLRTPPETSRFMDVRLPDTTVSMLAVPVLMTGQPVATVMVTFDLDRLEPDRSRMFVLAASEALIALLAGVLAGYLLLRRLLRTVGRITAAAARLGSGELDRRLGELGPRDEVGELAATFDSMAERLDTAMTAQRRLLSDVSHQLRTPLTVARGHLDVMMRTGVDDPQNVRETVDIVIDELDHMRALVEQLLLLGRAFEPDFVDPVAVDLRSLLADLMDAAKVLAPRKWVLGAVPDLVLCVDAAKLRGALLNLVDNAVHATDDGDTIALFAELRPGDGGIALSVEDSGPGIPAELRAAALSRFGRPGARDTAGSGLGLAIVQAVAVAHQGEVVLDESRYGGCRATVLLPRAVLLLGEVARTVVPGQPGAALTWPAERRIGG
ncbi:MAG: integral rane sensor signal transduction histidine kinase [Frankiales bacterium]|nr:integral rane sensor signal transduction histidine kinase [Frankiales bacterium]